MKLVKKQQDGSTSELKTAEKKNQGRVTTLENTYCG